MLASREDVRERLKVDRFHRVEMSSPERDVFRKTAALISAIRKTGCGAPKYEETAIPASEQMLRDENRAWIQKIQRGYQRVETTCEGRIYLRYDDREQCGRLYLRYSICCMLAFRDLTQDFCRCEHYSTSSRDHYIHYLDDSYDTDYLEAYFHEDSDELDRIEQEVWELGAGPLAECTTVSNFSSQRIFCRESDPQSYYYGCV